MTEPAALDNPAALTGYIETRYHARHRQQLPELIALAEKVETVHAADPNTPAGLAALLRKLIGEMEAHMKKEELTLFPAIRRGGSPGIEQSIAVMRGDHDDRAVEVAEIRRITGGLTLPEGACRKWTALYAGLGVFIDDLEARMRLENDVPSLASRGPPDGRPRLVPHQQPTEEPAMIRQTLTPILTAALLAAAPAAAQEQEEPWLPSLITETPELGFNLAVSMARKAVTTTQTDAEILHALRPNYSHDPQSLIDVSGVVASYFATIAEANDFWRE